MARGNAGERHSRRRGNLPLTYSVNATGLAAGLYQAHLRIENDGPYGPLVVPLTLTVTPPPPTDLAIEVTDDPDPGRAGTRLDYRVKVHNNGPVAAIGTVVTDTLPTGVSPLLTSGCSGTPGGATCVLGDIPVGGEASATIRVEVGVETRGQILNRVSVASAGGDPVAENDSANASTQIIPFGDLNGDLCVGRADGDILLGVVRVGGGNPAIHDINRDGAVNRADPRALMLRYANPPGGACP